jgi:hypothetical protein
MDAIIAGRAVTLPVVVRALTYHTIDNTIAHAEGDLYDIDDAVLFETLIGIGFVEFSHVVP